MMVDLGGRGPSPTHHEPGSSDMKTRLIGTVVAVLTVSTAAACGGSSNSSSGSSKTLTYWASNQATSLDKDKEVLTPELAKFEQQTGVKVNLQVIGWPDLLNKILAATTSGQGPDVLNIGNTWAASLDRKSTRLTSSHANIS